MSTGTSLGVFALLAVAFVSAIIFTEHANQSGKPSLDWAAGPNGGWCCAKPHRWCVPSQICLRESPYQGGPCIEWVAGEHCEDLCGEWRKQPGGRGKACGGAP
jgi:hypothetical protein